MVNIGGVKGMDAVWLFCLVLFICGVLLGGVLGYRLHAREVGDWTSMFDDEIERACWCMDVKTFAELVEYHRTPPHGVEVNNHTEAIT